VVSDFEVLVNQPLPDVLIESIHLTPDQSLSLVVYNNSNFPISRLELMWWLGNDAPVSEFWDGMLLAGESMDFVFSSSPNPSASNYQFLCAEVLDLTTNFAEIAPNDNRRCLSIQWPPSTELYPPYPNPATDKVSFVLLSNSNSDAEVKVFDSVGKLLYQASAPLMKGYNQFDFSCESWESGNYVLHVQSNANHLTQHFFVSKPKE